MFRKINLERIGLAFAFGAIFVILVVVPITISSVFSTPESRGEAPPTKSSVDVCQAPGTDCPIGGMRVRFGTTLVQVSSAVGNTDFVVHDILGDHRATGRQISVSLDGETWIGLSGATYVDLRMESQPLFKVSELGQVMTCSIITSLDRRHSAGFILSCDK